MATPHVAASAALLLAQDPARDADTLRALLVETATDLATPGWDVGTGHGLVAPWSALRAGV